jgi:hypothetical protein
MGVPEIELSLHLIVFFVKRPAGYENSHNHFADPPETMGFNGSFKAKPLAQDNPIPRERAGHELSKNRASSSSVDSPAGRE